MVMDDSCCLTGTRANFHPKETNSTYYAMLNRLTKSSKLISIDKSGKAAAQKANSTFVSAKLDLRRQPTASVLGGREHHHRLAITTKNNKINNQSRQSKDLH